MFVFLPAVLLVYYLVPLKWRNAVLLAFSLVFYGWGEPVYVFVMIASIAMDYFFGLWLEKEKRRENDRGAKLAVALSVTLNLLIFFVFKYLDFFIENLRLIPGLSSLRPLGITLPIGISFYTFQKMSYIIDLYRGECGAQKNAVSFGAYVTMFPQLIAGPIVKYRDVASQLEAREYSMPRFGEGAGIFTVGLAKKILLANGIGALYDAYKLLPAAQLTTAGTWLATIAFTFQIYFDFSGYSDMAVGLGKMLGFEFMRNFDYPYISRSVTEFWRRWHISLSTWFREYLYIPLGGNRVSHARWFFNILIVWLVTGFWHGASWNFVLWGLYYAALLIIEKQFLLKLLDDLPRWIGRVYTALAFTLGWGIFACSDSLLQCAGWIKALFGSGALFNAADGYYLQSYLPMLIALSLACLPCWKKYYLALGEKRRRALDAALVCLGLLLCTAAMVDSSYNPFLYFRF